MTVVMTVAAMTVVAGTGAETPSAQNLAALAKSHPQMCLHRGGEQCHDPDRAWDRPGVDQRKR